MSDYNPNQFEHTFAASMYPPGQHEASADTREAASGMMEIFTGLVAEGFTEDQALTLVAKIIVEAQR